MLCCLHALLIALLLPRAGAATSMLTLANNAARFADNGVRNNTTPLLYADMRCCRDIRLRASARRRACHCLSPRLPRQYYALRHSALDARYIDARASAHYVSLITPRLRAVQPPAMLC